VWRRDDGPREQLKSLRRPAIPMEVHSGLHPDGLPRPRDIEHNFGSNVARMVEGLSDSLTEDPHNKQSWEERKQDYIRKLRRELADVQLISAADKLHNARTVIEDYREIGPRIWERFKRGRREQIWYFDELLKVYKSSEASRIVDELERVVNEIREISAGDPH